MKVSVDMEYITCLQCRGHQTKPFISAQDYENPNRELFHLEQCSTCGLVFQNPRPLLEELPNYYHQDKYYSYVELEKKKTQKIGALERLRHFLFEKTVEFYYGRRREPLHWIYAWIGKGRFGAAPLDLKPGGRILDIGCGDGVFLDVVQRLGWEAHGVEFSEGAAKRAQAAGLRVHAGDLLTANYPAGHFDVVRIWSVLEHVPSPSAVLEKIREILKPDGVLILQVPNIRSTAFGLFGRYWSGLDLPRHLTHFSPDTLRAACQKSGLKVVRLRFSSVGTMLASLNFWRRLKEQRFAHRRYLWIGYCQPLLRVANVAFDRACDLLQKGDCMVAWVKKEGAR